MAIEDIDNLTRPLSDLVGEQGEKAAKRKKQLAEVRATRAAGMTADEAKAAAERGDFGEVGQGEERMDFLATPLVTPTDFNLAYNEPGALDYADRFDFKEKTTKPSLANRIFKGIVTAAGPGKFRVGLNVLLNAPDILSGIFKSGKKINVIKTERMQEILKDIGQDKLSEFETQPALIKYIKENYDFVADQQLVSKSLSRGKFKLKPKQPTPVDEKFVELFENNPKLINRIGKNQANLSLLALIDEEPSFVLTRTNKELVDFFKTKNINIKSDMVTRIRNLYRKHMGIKEGKYSYEHLVSVKDPRVDSILEDVLTNRIKAYEGALLIEDIFPRSGFLDRGAKRMSLDGVPAVTSNFTKLFNDYKSQLDNPALISIVQGKNRPRLNFNNLNVGEIVPTNATTVLRQSVIIDEGGKTFNQARREFLKNDIVSHVLNKTNELFENPGRIFHVDHIQPPRFGGTNQLSNFRLISNADHVTLKSLPTSKTLASDIVKSKSKFENDYFNLSKRLIDNVKNNNFEAADKIAENLNVLTNNFKNTFKNTDFIVGTPHVAIKSGENSVKYVNYGDYIKLSNKQKKYIKDNNLLPERSNLPNQGKSVEKQAEEIFEGYAQIYNLIGKLPDEPIAKIAGEITSMAVPRPVPMSAKFDLSRLKDGGIASINYATRPLNAER